jgi:hypothetical protein
MSRFGLAVAISCVISTTAFAADSHMADVLRRLDPATRFEQACDSEAMTRIRKDDAALYHPDRAVADALNDAKVTGDTMEASAAAASGIVCRSPVRRRTTG